MKIESIPEKYGIRVHSDDLADFVFLRFRGLEKGNGERKQVLNSVLNLPFHGDTLVIFHETDGSNPAFSITEQHLRKRLIHVGHKDNIGDALGSAIKEAAEYCMLTAQGLAVKKLSIKKLRGISICNYKGRHRGSYADTIKDMAPEGWECLLN